MNLNKKFNCFKLDTLDLVSEVKYERDIRREFYKELSSDSARDRKREKRPSRISQWCSRIFNF